MARQTEPDETADEASRIVSDGRYVVAGLEPQGVPGIAGIRISLDLTPGEFERLHNAAGREGLPMLVQRALEEYLDRHEVPEEASHLPTFEDVMADFREDRVRYAGIERRLAE